jgi:hypothetical protein
VLLGVDMTVFWDAAVCGLEEILQCFRGAYCLHLQGDAVVIKAVSTSETSANICQTTWYKIPDNNHFYACKIDLLCYEMQGGWLGVLEGS